MELKRQLGLFTAILIILADVIGTGIFVTTGDILGITANSASVLALWAVGGVVALTGSLCYAELASIWPEDGGEYVYLKNIFGPLPSFLTGWVSLIVGFSASVSISAMTLVIYLDNFLKGGIISGMWTQKILASLIILIFGIMHIIGVKRGSLIQNALTVLKLLIVFSLICIGFYFVDWGNSGRLIADYSSKGGVSVLEYGFPLLIIMFAYSGWNGANYIAGEIKDPERNLPRALFFGALLITAVYLALNVVFIISIPGEELINTHAVGAVAAENIFSDTGIFENVSSVFTLSISLILLSSVSVQMMVGPRVYYAMAKDRMIFGSLSRINGRFQTPALAIAVQMFVAILYVFLGRENINILLGYMGFSLGIFPLMAIIGLMVLRFKEPELKRGYSVPLFPLVPLIYILLTLAMMVSSLIVWTKTSLFAIAVVLIGIPIYYAWQKFKG